MSDQFPGLGRRFLVDFVQFRVQLFFSSLTSMTYTGVKQNGTLGSSETVAITIQPVRDGLFLVFWQETDQTTVVHLEDYKDSKITTLITGPDLQFQQFHGTFSLSPE